MRFRENRPRPRHLFWLIPSAFAMAGIMCWVFMLLWNWLMPVIFKLPEINFWQALGLFLLSKILFSGVGHNHHFHRRRGLRHSECCTENKNDAAEPKQEGTV